MDGTGGAFFGGVRTPLLPPTAASLAITCMSRPQVKEDGKMGGEREKEQGKIDRLKGAKWSESLPHPPSPFLPTAAAHRGPGGGPLRTLASIKIAACLHKVNTARCCLYRLPHLTLLHNTNMDHNSVYLLMNKQRSQM